MATTSTFRMFGVGRQGSRSAGSADSMTALPEASRDNADVAVTVPVELQRSIECVLQEGERGPRILISVDEKERMSGPFLTWYERIQREHHNAEFVLDYVTVAQLQKLKRGNAAHDVNAVSQDTLNRARRLFVYGAAAGATDISIEIGRDDARAVLRIDGSLFVSDEYSMHVEEGTRFRRAIYNGLARNKSAANSSFDPRAYQDAQIPENELLGSGLQNVRILTGPSDPIDFGGGFMSTRLQKRQGASANVDRAAARRALRLSRPARPEGELRVRGFRPDQNQRLERIVARPDGMLISTGPTGAGKSTTQFKLLEHIARTSPDRRQVSMEKPIELSMWWATQLLAGDHSYLDLLEKALRMDPDVIMLQEMRSAQEAIAALQAALTGHLVLSTLHVKDPYRVFERLEDMDPARLSLRAICDHEQVIGAIGQRVLPVLCSSCKQPLKHPHAEHVPHHILAALETWGSTENVHTVGPGCDTCDGTGLSGQVAVGEIVETDAALMDAFRNGSIDEAKRQHRKNGKADYSLCASAVALVLAGLVCPNQAQRKIHIDNCDDEALPEVAATEIEL